MSEQGCSIQFDLPTIQHGDDKILKLGQHRYLNLVETYSVSYEVEYHEFKRRMTKREENSNPFLTSGPSFIKKIKLSTFGPVLFCCM